MLRCDLLIKGLTLNEHCWVCVLASRVAQICWVLLFSVHTEPTEARHSWWCSYSLPHQCHDVGLDYSEHCASVKAAGCLTQAAAHRLYIVFMARSNIVRPDHVLWHVCPSSDCGLLGTVNTGQAITKSVHRPRCVHKFHGFRQSSEISRTPCNWHRISLTR